MAVDEKPVLESWKEISSLPETVAENLPALGARSRPSHSSSRRDAPKAHVFAYPEELDLWLAKKPHDREAPDRGPKPARRSKLGPALVAAGVLRRRCDRHLMGPHSRTAAPRPPRPSPWLAILNFDRPGGDESLEAWKTALPCFHAGP